MSDATRRKLRQLGEAEALATATLLVIYLILAITGYMHWSGMLAALIPASASALFLGASRMPLPSRTKQIEPKVKPFTLAPTYDQCPVCGIADLADYRYKDSFLQLEGNERYVQKWGKHDAHWSCVSVCPYTPTHAEVRERDHRDGKHDLVLNPDCDLCLRKLERQQVIEDDQTNAQQGCSCRRCFQKLYSASYYIHRGLSGYEFDDSSFDSRHHHYKLMAAQSEPGSVRHAYAIEMMEKVRDE